MFFEKMQTRKNDGFTLVELIVVIAILAILAGIAVPAYSGYIEKANVAADEQLLHTVNIAFASACAENGIVPASATATYGGTTGARTVVGVSTGNEKVNNAFSTFYAGNENATFKVYDRLYYANGLFNFMAAEYSALVDYLTENYPDAIDAVIASIYNSIGYNNLAGNIDNAAMLIAGLTTEGSDAFTALLLSEENYATLYNYYKNDETAVDALFDAKYAQLKNDPDYAEWDDDKLYAEAENQIMANVAVLTAASNANAVTEDFITALGNGTAVGLLKGSLDVEGNATEDTIAQSAFAYAMYTSYAASRGMDTSGELDLETVYDVLDTTDFQKYINEEAEVDIAGYQGAMTLIKGSADSSNNSTINDILLNGFNNSDLIGLMQNVTAK